MSKTPLSEYRVSVLAVDGDSSAPGRAMGWTDTVGPWLSCNQPDEPQRDLLGKEAALRWWRETDQSTDCAVTLRFEGRHYGVDVSFTRKVRLTIETDARVVPLSPEESDGLRHLIQAEREAVAS